MTRTVRIDLAYDGSAFHGWQVQPELRTVQGELARLLSRLLGRETMPTGAGRTDAERWLRRWRFRLGQVVLEKTDGWEAPLAGGMEAGLIIEL